MVYEREKALLGKTFQVVKAWKIGICNMKENDILTVEDYGSGMACDFVVFGNNRLPRYRFHTGTWLFIRNTKQIE